MDETSLTPPLNRESTPGARRQGRLAAAFLMMAGVLVILIAFTLSALARRLPGELPQVGRPLPDFNLPDLNGRAVRLSDYSGQPVLINFWASWCPPCRAEMPDLEALYTEHQTEGLVILAINSGESQSIAAAFAEEYGLSFPVLLDENAALSDQWMINNLPTTILVGRDGLVKVIRVGLLRSEQIESAIMPHLIP